MASHNDEPEARDVLGGSDLGAHEDELGGPDLDAHEDELGGPDLSRSACPGSGFGCRIGHGLQQGLELHSTGSPGTRFCPAHAA